MAEHNDFGIKGEQIAKEYLRKKNYLILETNWKFKKGEIDIIAKEDDKLVVVEVKTRDYRHLVDPEKSVTRTKQKLLIKTANAYINFKNLPNETRFDVILVIMENGIYHINHIADAFYPHV